MPHFFFDIHTDKDTQIDDTGHSFETIEEVRKEAQRLLPEIAYHDIPTDGDHRAFMVLVRGEDGRSIFTAALHYQGHKVGKVS